MSKWRLTGSYSPLPTASLIVSSATALPLLALVLLPTNVVTPVNEIGANAL